MTVSKAVLLVVLLASCSVAPIPGASASCVDISFEEQVRLADAIFVATVDSARAFQTPRTVITRYRLRDVQLIKGKASAGLNLAQHGGRAGKMEVVSNLAVELVAGRRYVIFASVGREPDFSGTLVPQACGWGPFGVWSDSGFSAPVVHFRGGPLLALDRQHIISLRDRTWETDYPPDGKYPTFYNSKTNTWDLPASLRRPPRRSLGEAILLADAEYAESYAGWDLSDSERQRYLERVKLVLMWPHQDPGTRISEADFVEWLRKISDSLHSEEGLPPR